MSLWVSWFTSTHIFICIFTHKHVYASWRFCYISRINQLIYYTRPEYISEHVSLYFSQWLPHTKHIWVWFAFGNVWQTVASRKCNSFADLSLLAASCSKYGRHSVTVYRLSIPVHSRSIHRPTSGVHYAMLELKLSWFTNEIIRHGGFFGNENAVIGEIIFPAFVLF